MEQKQDEMPTTIFRPTSPTNQNRPTLKISNFCVICPICMKFGMGANNEPETTWAQFEMATTVFNASTDTPQIPSRTITLFRFLGSQFMYFFIFFHEAKTSKKPKTKSVSRGPRKTKKKKKEWESDSGEEDADDDDNDEESETEQDENNPPKKAEKSDKAAKKGQFISYLFISYQYFIVICYIRSVICHYMMVV